MTPRCGPSPVGRTLRRLALLAVLAVMAGGEALAAASAVVLSYRRFGEDGARGNVDLAQFEAQLAELRRGGYTVLPLSQVVAAIAEGRPLPERAVAIAIDGAALSVWSEALPRLAEAGLPFTVFVATEQLDRYEPERMSWDHLREIAAAGAEIGFQGAAGLNAAEADLGAIGADLMRGMARLRAELGREPALLAWPEGAASAEAMGLAEALGLAAAFGSHAGALARGLDPMYLPRQMVDARSGELAAFRRLAAVRPLAVTDLVPDDPRLASNPPPFGFTVAAGEDEVTCRSSHHGPMQVERLGDRVEVRVTQPFPPGRASIRCTAGPRSFGYDYWVPRPGAAQAGGLRRLPGDEAAEAEPPVAAESG